MISLKGINLSYKRNKPVLQDLNMELASGHIYGLLGKNGEGKTTLLNILCGLLFPDKGTCTVLGEIPARRSAKLLQQLFLLPEEIALPDVTVSAYISMYAPFYPTFDQEILKACIEQFEIDVKGKVTKMSQGQRKKVAITLALAAHTPLLLMDEPTNGLDIPSKAVFRRLVANYIGEHQMVIISTHQVRDLESLIDSVLILEKKQILLGATLDEIGEKLAFRQVTKEEPVLYSEPTPGGMMGVIENKEKEVTPVSLELLFNTVTTHPREIERIFNR